MTWVRRRGTRAAMAHALRCSTGHRWLCPSEDGHTTPTWHWPPGPPGHRAPYRAPGMAMTVCNSNVTVMYSNVHPVLEEMEGNRKLLMLLQVKPNQTQNRFRSFRDACKKWLAWWHLNASDRSPCWGCPGAWSVVDLNTLNFHELSHVVAL